MMSPCRAHTRFLQSYMLSTRPCKQVGYLNSKVEKALIHITQVTASVATEMQTVGYHMPSCNQILCTYGVEYYYSLASTA